MTTQLQMKETLAAAGIPAKQIECYGSQIVITAWGKDAADKWAALLAKFANLRGVIQTIDENIDNHNTTLKPSTHKVWRVFASI